MHVPQHRQVQPQLVGFLVPPAEGAPAGHRGAVARKLHAFLRENRPAGMVRQRRAAVHLHGDRESLAALRLPADHLVGNILVRMVHPVRPARAENLAVHKQHGLPAGVQVHHNPLAAGFRRYGKAAEHPGIVPGLPPYRSGRPGRPGKLLRFRQGQRPGGREALQFNLPQRVVQVSLQRPDQVGQLFADFVDHVRAPLAPG